VDYKVDSVKPKGRPKRPGDRLLKKTVRLDNEIKRMLRTTVNKGN